MTVFTPSTIDMARRPENPSCSYNSQKAFCQNLVRYLNKCDCISVDGLLFCTGRHTRRPRTSVFVETIEFRFLTINVEGNFDNWRHKEVDILWCLLTKNFCGYNGTSWRWQCFWCWTHVLWYNWETEVLSLDFEVENSKNWIRFQNFQIPDFISLKIILYWYC